MMDLSVVVLNWNAAEDTIACVRRLDGWTRIETTIWVVDNASIDNSVEAIRRACPPARLIQNQLNLGFAGGTNQGIIHALNESQAPILLLNNDAHIAEDDVIRLLETLRNDSSIGLVGPLLYDQGQKERLLSAGAKNPVLHHQTRSLQLDPARPVQVVEAISGTAVIIRAEIFNAVGLLDEAYFFSTELADLCARSKKMGFFSAVDARARAYHAVSRSARLRSTLYTYYIIRNRFLYIRKFYRYLMKASLFCFWGGYGLALMMRLSLTGQRAAAKAVYLGTGDGWRGRFDGQNERVLAACSDSRPSFVSKRPENLL